jgi:hypothetical protein
MPLAKFEPAIEIFEWTKTVSPTVDWAADAERRYFVLVDIKE